MIKSILKVVFSIFIVLTVLSGILITMRKGNIHLMIEHTKKLSYIFVKRTNGSIAQTTLSLDPSLSDYWHNQSLLNSIVGTLVKYGPSGRIEPFLAESFHVSDDKLIWSFKLKSNLICEDGQPINAENFQHNLLGSLRRYSESGSTLVFDLLLGWSDFALNKKQSLDGLTTTNSNEIVFKFKRAPEDFLEFLRMVYFGYWCHDKNGRLVSSGPYKVDRVINETSINVVRNPRWHFDNEEAPQQIEFKILPYEDTVLTDDNSMIVLGLRNPEDKDLNRFHHVLSTPTFLRSFILSPFKDGIFKSVNNRRIFHKRILELMSKKNVPLATTSNLFYPSAKPSTPIEIPKTSEFFEGNSNRISVLGPSDSKDMEGRIFRELISEALKDTSIDIDFITDPKAFSESDINSNAAVDIRIEGVDIGGHILNLGTKMMFCSKMGVSFPDPSNRLCRFVDEYDKDGRLVDQHYIDQFNKILIEDSSVIPLYLKSLSWLIGKGVDLNTIPPVVIHPRFETIRLK